MPKIAGPDDDLDSHLLCAVGVNPRRPSVRVFASGEAPKALSPAPLRQSRFPGPGAIGRRLCALPFRWSLPLSVAWNYLIYVSAPSIKTLRIVGVGEENQPGESSGLPRRRGFISNLGSCDVGFRGGSDSYIGRNRGVSKVGQESCMSLGHPGKSGNGSWGGPWRPPRPWSSRVPGAS